MIQITKTKKLKNYQMPKMPLFHNRKEKILWLRRQKMLAMISNVKSVSVQVKDIRQMIYSNNPRLISLYTKLQHSKNKYKDNDYIPITKSTSINESQIYALLSADWLLDMEVVRNKSLEELREECDNLQNQIARLNETRNNAVNPTNLDNKIRLLKYKLSNLIEITLTKADSSKILATPRIEEVNGHFKKLVLEKYQRM